MKTNLTTMNSKILKEFAKGMKNTKRGSAWVQYKLATPDFKSAEESRIWEETPVVDRIKNLPRKKGLRLFLKFHHETGNFVEGTWQGEDVFLDTTTGEAHYWNSKSGSNLCFRLGVLNSDEINILVPLYTKLYLEVYARIAKSEPDLEVRNEFAGLVAIIRSLYK